MAARRRFLDAALAEVTGWAAYTKAGVSPGPIIDDPWTVIERKVTAQAFATADGVLEHTANRPQWPPKWAAVTDPAAFTEARVFPWPPEDDFGTSQAGVVPRTSEDDPWTIAADIWAAGVTLGGCTGDGPTAKPPLHDVMGGMVNGNWPYVDTPKLDVAAGMVTGVVADLDFEHHARFGYPRPGHPGMPPRRVRAFEINTGACAVLTTTIVAGDPGPDDVPEEFPPRAVFDPVVEMAGLYSQ